MTQKALFKELKSVFFLKKELKSVAYSFNLIQFFFISILLITKFNLLR
jgi:hypothetical protein